MFSNTLAAFEFAVFEAVKSNKGEVLKKLLMRGVKSDGYVDSVGNTALHQAAIVAKPSLIALLLEFNADPTKINAERESAPFLAARMGHWDCVKKLVQHKKDFDNMRQYDDVLMLAASANRFDMVELLLKAGANPNNPLAMSPQTQNSPLHIAASLQNPRMMAVLLEHNADPSSINSLGETPIDITTKLHHWDGLDLYITPKQFSTYDARIIMFMLLLAHQSQDDYSHFASLQIKILHQIMLYAYNDFSPDFADTNITLNQLYLHSVRALNQHLEQRLTTGTVLSSQFQALSKHLNAIVAQQASVQDMATKARAAIEDYSRINLDRNRDEQEINLLMTFHLLPNTHSKKNAVLSVAASTRSHKRKREKTKAHSSTRNKTKVVAQKKRLKSKTKSKLEPNKIYYYHYNDDPIFPLFIVNNATASLRCAMSKADKERRKNQNYQICSMLNKDKLIFYVAKPLPDNETLEDILLDMQTRCMKYMPAENNNDDDIYLRAMKDLIKNYRYTYQHLANYITYQWHDFKTVIFKSQLITSKQNIYSILSGKLRKHKVKNLYLSDKDNMIYGEMTAGDSATCTSMLKECLFKLGVRSEEPLEKRIDNDEIIDGALANIDAMLLSQMGDKLGPEVDGLHEEERLNLYAGDFQNSAISNNFGAALQPYLSDELSVSEMEMEGYGTNFPEERQMVHGLDQDDSYTGYIPTSHGQDNLVSAAHPLSNTIQPSFSGVLPLTHGMEVLDFTLDTSNSTQKDEPNDAIHRGKNKDGRKEKYRVSWDETTCTYTNETKDIVSVSNPRFKSSRKLLRARIREFFNELKIEFYIREVNSSTYFVSLRYDDYKKLGDKDFCQFVFQATQRDLASKNVKKIYSYNYSNHAAFPIIIIHNCSHALSTWLHKVFRHKLENSNMHIGMIIHEDKIIVYAKQTLPKNESLENILVSCSKRYEFKLVIPNNDDIFINAWKALIKSPYVFFELVNYITYQWHDLQTVVFNSEVISDKQELWFVLYQTIIKKNIKDVILAIADGQLQACIHNAEPASCASILIDRLSKIGVKPAELYPSNQISEHEAVLERAAASVHQTATESSISTEDRFDDQASLVPAKPITERVPMKDCQSVLFFGKPPRHSRKQKNKNEPVSESYKVNHWNLRKNPS